MVRMIGFIVASIIAWKLSQHKWHRISIAYGSINLLVCFIMFGSSDKFITICNMIIGVAFIIYGYLGYKKSKGIQ